MTRIKVGVLRGGPSREYETSLKTGQHILQMLNTEPLCEHYKGVDIFIDKESVWHIDGIPHIPEKALRKVDVIFNATKGNFGEDGKLQKILESFSMPYVGTSTYGSSVSLNKVIAKEHFKKAGIKTPYYKELHILPEQDIQPVALNLFRTFPMPVIVKPRGLGSSLGVSFASNVEELVEALNHAREFSEEVLVEEYLTGKEIISGFIDDFRGKDLYHLFPVEVKPQDMNLFGEKVKNDITPLSIPDEDEKTADVSISDLSPEELTLAKLQSPEEVPVVKKKHSIFDWITKHIGSYDHQSPANLKNEEKEAIEAAIKAARDVLGLRHFATADFIVHPRRGVYLLEINTQPGLHEHSPIYKSLDAAGVKHHEFLDHLLRLALKRGK
jgi:D-alanine--D-alanine ligase